MNFPGFFFIAVCIATTLETALSSFLYKRSDESICETEICKESSIRLQNSMNKSADPCTDFYEYACGGWIASHPIPASEEKYTVRKEVEEKVSKQIKDVLANPPVKPTNSKSVISAQSLYRECVDKDAREKKGVQPVKEYLDKFGGWPLLNPSIWDDSSYKWPDVIAKLIRKLFLDALFVILPSVDYDNPDYNILYVLNPEFQAGKDEMSDMTGSDRAIAVIAAYKTYIIKSAELLGAEVNDDLKKAVDDLVNFESALAKLIKVTEDSRMTVAKLQETIPDPIEWKSFINTILEGYDPVEDSTELVVDNVKYLKEMFSLVKNTDIKTVANYIGWKIVAKINAHSNEAFRDAEFQFDKVVKEIDEIDPLDDFCAQQTKAILSFAVGRLYAEKYYDNEVKTDVENLVKNLRNVYKQVLIDSTWMDEDTKKLALEKLDAMGTLLPFPEWIMDDKKLDEYYEGMPDLSGKPYFESLIAAVEGVFGLHFKKWNKEVEQKTRKTTMDFSAGAFYYLPANSFTFLAGVLNPPFYQHNRVPSMNYGAIGKVIGAGISHGLDFEGKDYDKDGNFEEWWTPKTKENFREKAKCFKDQYGSYVEPTTGLKLNSKDTLIEDIADNGGIRNAYKAYKLHLQETGEAPQRLPDIDASPDQLFYLSFASMFCSSESKESLKETIEEDFFSPSYYRVNVPLSNSEDFAKAFNCAAGTPMNPANKCVLW